MAGKKGMKHYPQAIKERAVRMHLEEGKTKREIMKELGIVSERRLKMWCSEYRREGMLGLQSKPKGRPRKMIQTPQAKMEYELNRLKMENELLRNFLYEAGRR